MDSRKKVILREHKDRYLTYLGYIIIFVYAFLLLSRSFLGPMEYGEIDTNVLPGLAAQRGSLIVTQQDIDRARVDYPQFYANIEGYDDLRLSKLIKITEDEWFSYYFPIYPALCIPIKIFFDLIGVAQERSFYVTNTFLIIAALLFVQKKLKVTASQKIIAVLLLAISPIIYYNNYLNYEAFIFSMVTISLVLYYNGNRKASAVFLSLGGMSNSSVMAIGLVMIAHYGVTILWDNRRQSIFLTVKQWWKETVLYAMCFVPCLIPFMAQNYYLKRDTFSSSGTMVDYKERFLSYLFDPNLGISSFAFVALMVFFVLIIRSLFAKKFVSIIWLAFLLSTIGAYSLMMHINCGQLYCSRYVVWTYPIIPIYISTIGYEFLTIWQLRYGVYGLSIASNLFFMLVNPCHPYTSFNPTAQWLLKNAPAIYNPYSATFYSRTLHVDGAYQYTQPAYYKDPVTEQIYKLIYRAVEGAGEEILFELKGDKQSMAYLEQEIDKIGIDGKFHYINFPSWGEYAVYEKSPVEKGELSETEIQWEIENITLQNWGSVNGYNLPIQIKPDTNYQIKLTLPDDFDITLYPTFFIDFYSDGGYDSPAQEKSDFLQEGRYNYEFYFNSGTFEGDFMDAYARIVTNMGEPAEISYFCVTELEQAISPAA